jgi:gliding motility-associated-like protein
LALQATASAGATLNWYGTNATGGTASALAPTPSTTALGSTTYFVSQSNTLCESNRVGINVTTLPLITPSFNFESSFCAGTIQPPFPNSALNGISGTWSPSILDNTTSGSYTFMPNPNQCAISITVDITVHQLTLLQIETFVSGSFNENQTITVLATNTGDYFYQLDQGALQNENVFENVPPGMHTVVVYDKNGCSDPIKDDEVLVINYPLYFTPNEDGFNDSWNIVGLSNLDQYKINIYDRYGKFLKAIESSGQGWDGTFNNKLLPSDDYWFTISYLANGNCKEFKSHFSLKR